MGTRWHYGLCHDVLGALVEALSGQRFEEYVKAHIFDPLQMMDSTYSISENKQSGLAQQYTYDEVAKKPILCRPVNKYIMESNYDSGGAGSNKGILAPTVLRLRRPIFRWILNRTCLCSWTNTCCPPLLRAYRPCCIGWFAVS